MDGRNPRANATVLIQEGKILAVQTQAEFAKFNGEQNIQIKDYGNAIILPGLINLHTHLDYSLFKPLEKDKGLLPWTKALMQQALEWKAEDWLVSAQAGAKKAAQAGTTSLVDSSYSGSAAYAIAQAGLRGIVGLELFGVDENNAEIIWTQWQKRYGDLINDPSLKEALAEKRLTITVAPHAPYTVCPGLWSKANEWAKTNKRPLLAHIAESQEECHWFTQDNAAMQKHLQWAFTERLNKPPMPKSVFAWKKTGSTPVEHLEKNNLLNERLLAAHLTLVTESDLEKLSENSVSIAHCPRSNENLQNSLAPLEKMLAYQLKVGLGTDSLASVDDLNLLSEARFAIERHKAANSNSSFDAKKALESMTIKAAECLNMADKIGSLETGKLADIAIFQIPDRLSSSQTSYSKDTDPHTLLIHDNCSLIELLIGGKSVSMGFI